MEARLNRDAIPRWEQIGDAPVLIIDNVFENAEELREQALSLRFERPRNGAYPGLKAAASVQGGKALGHMLGQVFLSRRHGDRIPGAISLESSIVTTDFSLLTVSENALAGKQFNEQHVDSETWLASLVHLYGQPGVEVRERGTAFWRHRSSGLTTFATDPMPDPVQMLLREKLLGCPLSKQLPDALMKVSASSMNMLNVRVFKQEDSGRTPLSLEESDTWELVDVVPARFNRLVCYPSWFIHSAVEPPNNTPHRDTARLTMNCFVLYPFEGLDTVGVRYGHDGYLSVEGVSED